MRLCLVQRVVHTPSTGGSYCQHGYRSLVGALDSHMVNLRAGLVRNALSSDSEREGLRTKVLALYHFAFLLFTRQFEI